MGYSAIDDPQLRRQTDIRISYFSSLALAPHKLPSSASHSVRITQTSTSSAHPHLFRTRTPILLLSTPAPPESVASPHHPSQNITQLNNTAPKAPHSPSPAPEVMVRGTQSRLVGTPRNKMPGEERSSCSCVFMIS